jgi:hypothetical protein
MWWLPRARDAPWAMSVKPKPPPILEGAVRAESVATSPVAGVEVCLEWCVSVPVRGYEPLPTLMIGQLSLIEVDRSVSPPFFSSWLTWVSLLIRTGVALAFQVRIVSFQIGE